MNLYVAQPKKATKLKLIFVQNVTLSLQALKKLLTPAVGLKSLINAITINSYFYANIKFCLHFFRVLVLHEFFLIIKVGDYDDKTTDRQG